MRQQSFFTSAELIKAERFSEEREAFLLTIPDEDREEVDMLCRSYNSTCNDCGLNDGEKLALMRLQAKYPDMNKWLF